MSSDKRSFSYKDAGVDIEAGDKMVASISEMVKSTHNANVIDKYGHFGGFYELAKGGYDEPVLVSSVDGVGTKLIAAFKSKKYDTVGQDLVNHCVNDIAVGGADPLFFMDYFSTGKLDPDVGKEVVKGFATACRQNGVALLGGETAEMPDIYQPGEFDLAGTVVGILDKQNILTGGRVRKGDLLIGIPSNGLHTNGYSLARKVLFSEYEIGDYVEEFGQTVGEELLRIHTSYLPLIREIRSEPALHGMAHITGGGIEGNTKRLLGGDLKLAIQWDAWEYPAVFRKIREMGNVEEADMRRTFNLGVGLVIAAEKQGATELLSTIEQCGFRGFDIGEVV